MGTGGFCQDRLKSINRICRREQAAIWLAAIKTSPEPHEDNEQEAQEVNETARDLLKQYEDLFQPLQGTPPEKRVQHNIDLEDGARPVMRRPYRLSAAQVQDATEQLQKAMEQGWIVPSQSPWGMPILMVPKKDNKWRLCVDYRDLNAVTVQDAYPLPRIDDLLYEIGTSTWFSRLDLEAGYHQIWINPKDRAKTAFRIAKAVDGNCHFE